MSSLLASNTSSQPSSSASTYAQTEDTKSHATSALLTLYLLSPTPTGASTASFVPTLLIDALRDYLQTALKSSLAALARALATLPTLARTQSKKGRVLDNYEVIKERAQCAHVERRQSRESGSPCISGRCRWAGDDPGRGPAAKQRCQGCHTEPRDNSIIQLYCDHAGKDLTSTPLMMVYACCVRNWKVLRYQLTLKESLCSFSLRTPIILIRLDRSACRQVGRFVMPVV